MNFKRKIFLLFAVALIPAFLAAQPNFDKKISRNRFLLKNLKNEIGKLKNELNAFHKKEKNLLQQLNLIDKETALITRSKGILVQQKRLLNQKINRTNRQLQQAGERYEQLKALYAKRAVYSYKYGKIRTLHLLLASASLNQALIRYRYLKLIARHDRKMIESIKRRKDQISHIKEQLAADLQQKQNTLRQIRRQEADYADRRQRKKVLLKEVHWNQSKYQQLLAEKERQKQNLINLIVTLERERTRKTNIPAAAQEIHFKFKDFRKTKGRLLWPVKGKIITRYGKQRDPKSKTYIKNTDIEIKSRLGTPVHCVFSGVVRMITYLPGYGNTVIIDHGKGYYTVYSHLAEIYVQKNSPVETNQVIATVGDSGSLAGAKLQFGIYGGRHTYNPEKWLGRF